MPKLEGIITPTLTPISNDNLDYEAVDSLIEFLSEAGVTVSSLWEPLEHLPLLQWSSK